MSFPSSTLQDFGAAWTKPCLIFKPHFFPGWYQPPGWVQAITLRLCTSVPIFTRWTSTDSKAFWHLTKSTRGAHYQVFVQCLEPLPLQSLSGVLDVNTDTNIILISSFFNLWLGHLQNPQVRIQVIQCKTNTATSSGKAEKVKYSTALPWRSNMQNLYVETWPLKQLIGSGMCCCTHLLRCFNYAKTPCCHTSIINNVLMLMLQTTQHFSIGVCCCWVFPSSNYF